MPQNVRVHVLVHKRASEAHKRVDNASFLTVINLFVPGRDQSAAEQSNNLVEGHPPFKPLYRLSSHLRLNAFVIQRVGWLCMPGINI
jgi:hypothetical protein